MQYLALSVLGSSQPDIANKLCQLAAHYGCTLVSSRMTILGSEFAASLLLAGSWNIIAKLEAGLPSFEQKNDVRCIYRRTQLGSAQPNQLPYSIYVVAPNAPNVVASITQFFAEQGISIHDFYINSYKAPVSEAPMLALTLSITIPTAKLLADLRESFMVFCDDHNYDAVMEPQKN